jgi:hypothetical protein
MGDARRAYEHYRWAERYSRNGRDDKAGAHLKRALHYGLSGLNGLNGLNGLSGFGGVKRSLDTGELTTQEALVEAYEGSKAENRLGFLRSLCSAEFRCFFYDKPSEYNRISETQKALFKAKIAELRIGDEQESASIVRCLTALVDSLRLVPFSEFCTALAHCTVEMCTKAREAVQAGSVQKVKLLVAVSNIGVPDTLDVDRTKKSNEWIPLLLFAMLIAALEPESGVRGFMAASYPEALRVLDESRSVLFFPDDVALYHVNDWESPLDTLVHDGDLIVVCDDASYTGAQVTRYARILRLLGIPVPMIVVLPFASAEAIRKLEAIERVSVVTKGRIEFFGDLDGTKCDEIMRMHGLRGAMLYKATTVFQHKIADYVSFYPHLLLGSLDGKTYLLPDAKNKTMLTDCEGEDPVDRYDKAMSDSCLFAFYKNTMAGMDYTGYLNPAKLRGYREKGASRRREWGIRGIP